MTILCTRRIQFCAGHRVLNHESKCANLHGHNYVMLLYAGSVELDSIGRVIDFSVLKEKLGGWIDQHWDHSFIVYKADHEVIAALDQVKLNKPYFLADWNPTAENMANYILQVIAPKILVDTGISIVKIELWETENCKVEVSL